VTFKNIPGRYVEIGQNKPIIGLRSAMDALMHNVEGVMQANHSCGHDAHMTIALGVMTRFTQVEAALTGTIRAIFQPAEELGNGSVKVIKEGSIDDLDYLYGVHVRPHNEITYPNCAPSIEHGSSTFMRGKIHGKDHHGARPNE